jgi:hypothetical protein
MKILFLAILGLAVMNLTTPVMAQENGPVQIIDTGNGAGMMNWVDSNGQPHLQPIIIDRTNPNATLITPLGDGSVPNPLINQPSLGNTGLLDLTD